MIIGNYTADVSVGETAPSPISPEPRCRKETIRGGRCVDGGDACHVSAGDSPAGVGVGSIELSRDDSIIESPANTACLGGFTEALASFTACVTVGGTTRLFQTSPTASIESVADAEEVKLSQVIPARGSLASASLPPSYHSGKRRMRAGGGAGVRVKQAPRRPRKGNS